MSTDESNAIIALRQTIRWLIGGVGSIMVGAATVGGWVVNQEAQINQLQAADRESLQERGELRGELKSHSELMATIRQELALQNKDLSYIRSTLDKMEKRTLQQ